MIDVCNTGWYDKSGAMYGTSFSAYVTVKTDSALFVYTSRLQIVTQAHSDDLCANSTEPMVI